MDRQFGEEILVQSVGPERPLMLVFSSVNSNGFSFQKQFSDLSHNKIFVRDASDRWYQNGTGDITDSVAALADKIRTLIVELKPTRTVAFGTSMGGYAAILFGNLLELDAIVASSPQTIIDRRLPHTPTSDFSTQPHFDLTEMLRFTSAHRPHIIFSGGDDLVDQFNILRIAWKQIVHVPVKGQDHLAAVMLSKKREYHRAIEHCLRNEPYIPTVEAQPFVDNEDLRTLVRKQVEAQYLLEDLPRALNLAGKLNKAYPEWGAPYQALAELYERRGDRPRAIRAAKKGAELAPGSITIVNLYANLLLKDEQFDSAVKAFRAALKVRPKHYAGLCGIAIALARTGEREEALHALEKAIEIRPRLERATTIRADILAGITATAVRINDEDM